MNNITNIIKIVLVLTLLLISPQFLKSQTNLLPSNIDVRSVDDIFIEREMMIPPDTINIGDPFWRYKVWSQGFGFGKSEKEAYNKAYSDAFSKAERWRYVAEYFDKTKDVNCLYTLVPNVMSTTFFKDLDGEWPYFIVIWMRIDKESKE